MTTTTHKPLREVLPPAPQHWVGDGFPVRSMFTYPEHGQVLSPFLLMDWAGPARFEPTDRRRGVGEHPHRGFETVTIVYAGEVEHRDSSGGGGIITPGDVQWMTAGAGLVHEEFHGPDFAARGGDFEMIQLWVNLPAKDKMTPPRYQGITADRIPTVELEGGGTLRLITGGYDGTEGPAMTFSPILLGDLHVDDGGHVNLALPAGYTAAVVVRAGTARLAEGRATEAGSVGVFERDGDTLRIAADGDIEALLMAGEPLDEPIVGSGPFVMNTEGEIRQAMLDYQSGKMGRLG